MLVKLKENQIELKLQEVSCDFCDSTDLVTVVTTNNMKEVFSGEFSVVKCKRCGLIFQNPRLKKKDMFRWAYPDNSSHYSVLLKRPLRWNLDKFINRHRNWFMLLRNLLPIPFSKGRMLEIGCATGEYLAHCRELGWDVRGVEISKLACKRGKEVFNLDIFNGELEQAGFRDEEFDLILMNNLLEHVYSTKDLLKESYRVLKPHGLLIIGCPNIDSISFKIFKDCFYGLSLPFHLTHFSESTLRNYLESTGFSISKVRYSFNMNGFRKSLHCFLKKKLGIRVFQKKLWNVVLLPLYAMFAIFRKSDSFQVIAYKNNKLHREG